MSNNDAIILPFQDKHPLIDPSAYIAPGASIIGDVEIARDASVWFGCVLRGDDNFIRVGARSNVQDGTVIHVTYQSHPTIIGEGVIIGHGARLHGCTLEDGCLVGIGAIVLDGVIVERGAFIAAGALVTPGKRVPSGELWGGNPARKLRDMRDADNEYLRWDLERYLELTGIYRQD